jgi:hypothetical protein
MSRRKRVNGPPLLLRYVAACEEQVSLQRELITDLKEKGQSTKRAEAALMEYQDLLLQLRNHAQIMQEIMQPRSISRQNYEGD